MSNNLHVSNLHVSLISNNERTAARDAERAAALQAEREPAAERAADLQAHFWDINNNDELAMEIYSMMLKYNITRHDVMIYHTKYILHEIKKKNFFEKARLQPKTPILNLFLARKELPVDQKYENYLKANGAAGIVWTKLMDYLMMSKDITQEDFYRKLSLMARINFYNKVGTVFLTEEKPFVPKAKGGSYKNKSRKVRHTKRTRRAKTSKK